MITPEIIVIGYVIVAMIFNFVSALVTRELNAPLICLGWMWPFIIFIGALMAIVVGPAVLGEYLGGKQK